MDILKNNNMKVPDTKRGDPHQVSQQPSFLSDNKVSCALENGQVSSWTIKHLALNTIISTSWIQTN